MVGRRQVVSGLERGDVIIWGRVVGPRIDRFLTDQPLLGLESSESSTAQGAGEEKRSQVACRKVKPGQLHDFVPSK